MNLIIVKESSWGILATKQTLRNENRRLQDLTETLKDPNDVCQCITTFLSQM